MVYSCLLYSLRKNTAKYLLTACLMMAITYLSYSPWTWSATSLTMNQKSSQYFKLPLLERQQRFWKVLYPLIELHDPHSMRPEPLENVGAVLFDPTTEQKQPDITKLDVEEVLKMKKSHSNFIRGIGSAEKQLHPVYVPGRRGVVSSAGGALFPVFLSSLRMLRRVGSTLPVEVFVRDVGEYEQAICEDVLPSLDATCIVLSDVMGDVNIQQYQLKIFAVLFSSFEDVIWLDADCFPLGPPEELLDSEPFLSSGLVTWPDFWAPSISPLFYQISDQVISPKVIRQSSESGVFLASKRTHTLALLLAAYYNFYGPSYYYRLLSQGAPGEGDKETFLQAAIAVGAPFYTVKKRVQAIGHQTAEKLAGSAMVQADPRRDYALSKKTDWFGANLPVASIASPFFIHANYPKFNPGGNLFGWGWETTPTLKEDGTDGRAWTAPVEMIRSFGYDVERAYWEEIKWVACSQETIFKSWGHKEKLCQRVERYFKNVFGARED